MIKQLLYYFGHDLAALPIIIPFICTFEFPNRDVREHGREKRNRLSGGKRWKTMWRKRNHGKKKALPDVKS